jgi:hypothetical protein
MRVLKLGQSLVSNSKAPAGFPNKYAIDFDGVDDHIEIQDNSALRLNSSDASFSFWAKLDGLSNGDGKMICKALSAGADRSAYQIRTDDADLKFQFYYSGWRTVSATNFFTSTNWTHVVVTMKNSTRVVTIYKNGSVYQSGTGIVYPIPFNTGEVFFGCRGNLTNFFSGMLDEAAIYNAELSAAQVAAIYNSGNPTDLTDSAMPSGLVGWWRMGDPNGTAAYPTILDQSTNSNNGVMTNMASGDIMTNVP